MALVSLQGFGVFAFGEPSSGGFLINGSRIWAEGLALVFGLL